MNEVSGLLVNKDSHQVGGMSKAKKGGDGVEVRG